MEVQWFQPHTAAAILQGSSQAILLSVIHTHGAETPISIMENDSIIDVDGKK